LNADWLNTTPFVPPVTEGKVIKVYDGDTITIAAKLPYASSPVYKFSVRLSGIDCPEIKGSTEKEKELAKHARDALSERINGKMVSLRNVSTEKYGRLLADVYIDGECLNTWMLVHKYAIKYDGGTKTKPCEWR
jgi:endonuclease YncB( thermonuclease family)